MYEFSPCVSRGISINSYIKRFLFHADYTSARPFSACLSDVRLPTLAYPMLNSKHLTSKHLTFLDKAILILYTMTLNIRGKGRRPIGLKICSSYLLSLQVDPHLFIYVQLHLIKDNFLVHYKKSNRYFLIKYSLLEVADRSLPD